MTGSPVQRELHLARDLRLALDLADRADALSQARFRADDLVVTAKPDLTPVTDADEEIERTIREVLQSERPDDSVLGEELGEKPGEHPGAAGAPTRQWIIDPIDGTANFVRGVPVWATLIALAVDRVPVIGVVSAPALGKRWWAARGSGAYVQDITGTGQARSIRVSQVADLADASVACSGLDRWEQAGRLQQYLELSRLAWRSRDYGDAWPYMMVAEGLVDVAGEYGLKPYDMAALVPIIEEAGGRFSSVEGEPGVWNGSALA
ncbi:MAG: inositol monophosphatase family protein, partial [Microbacteriaceae bacterium]